MTNIREQVLEFHRISGQSIRETPTIPSDDEIRLRLKLSAEEFREGVVALLDLSKEEEIDIFAKLDNAIKNATIKVDLVELADALGDQDYIAEGTRLAFGINGEPIAAEIQRSNMAKFKYGVKRREDGKILKPADWTPPDIKGELIKQGWFPKD